jgi:HAD superfamily hydrolase (TIGR01509 family)
MGEQGRRQVEGVLLDVDGTLIDSNDAHARSWSEALKAFGREIPPERVRPLIGMGGDKLLPELLAVEPDSETGKKFAALRARIFLDRYVPHLVPTRGATELIKRFRAEGLRLIIATSARSKELNAMLEQVGLDDLIEKKTSASDAENSKPDPDIVHAALEKAKLSASTALMLGDTPYDIEAARRAGVDTIALRCGGWNTESLRDAIAVYDDPADLLAHFTSSLFSRATSNRARSDTSPAAAP